MKLSWKRLWARFKKTSTDQGTRVNIFNLPLEPGEMIYGYLYDDENYHVDGQFFIISFPKFVCGIQAVCRFLHSDTYSFLRRQKKFLIFLTAILG